MEAITDANVTAKVATVELTTLVAQHLRKENKSMDSLELDFENTSAKIGEIISEAAAQAAKQRKNEELFKKDDKPVDFDEKSVSSCQETVEPTALTAELFGKTGTLGLKFYNESVSLCQPIVKPGTALAAEPSKKDDKSVLRLELELDLESVSAMKSTVVSNELAVKISSKDDKSVNEVVVGFDDESSAEHGTAFTAELLEKDDKSVFRLELDFERESVSSNRSPVEPIELAAEISSKEHKSVDELVVEFDNESCLEHVTTALSVEPLEKDDKSVVRLELDFDDVSVSSIQSTVEPIELAAEASSKDDKSVDELDDEFDNESFSSSLPTVEHETALPAEALKKDSTAVLCVELDFESIATETDSTTSPTVAQDTPGIAVAEVNLIEFNIDVDDVKETHQVSDKAVSTESQCALALSPTKIFVNSASNTERIVQHDCATNTANQNIFMFEEPTRAERFKNLVKCKMNSYDWLPEDYEDEYMEFNKPSDSYQSFASESEQTELKTELVKPKVVNLEFNQHVNFRARGETNHKKQTETSSQHSATIIKSKDKSTTRVLQFKQMDGKIQEELKSAASPHRRTSTSPELLIRSNSFTLKTPSKALIDHIRKQQSKASFDVVPRKSTNRRASTSAIIDNSKQPQKIFKTGGGIKSGNWQLPISSTSSTTAHQRARTTLAPPFQLQTRRTADSEIKLKRSKSQQQASSTTKAGLTKVASSKALKKTYSGTTFVVKKASKTTTTPSTQSKLKIQASSTKQNSKFSKKPIETLTGPLVGYTDEFKNRAPIFEPFAKSTTQSLPQMQNAVRRTAGQSYMLQFK